MGKAKIESIENPRKAHHEERAFKYFSAQFPHVAKKITDLESKVEDQDLVIAELTREIGRDRTLSGRLRELIGK
jgi:hypothetical protein